MPVNLSHFAIECDDVERAKRFYEAVFGWRIAPWGPPGFYQIFTGTADQPGVLGALQQRREPLTGTGVRGFECSFSVDSIKRVINDVLANGGSIAMAEFRIEGIGNGAFFLDTEGNRFAALQYDATLTWPVGTRAPN